MGYGLMWHGFSPTFVESAPPQPALIKPIRVYAYHPYGCGCS